MVTDEVRASDRTMGPVPDRLSLTEFTALVLIAGLAVAAWAGLLSAQVARLSSTVAVIAGLLAALAAAALAWRLTGRPAPSGPDALVALVVVIGLTRLWPVSVPWPVFLDPSWYSNTAARIAADGGLRFEVPALADLPEDLRGLFVATFRDQAAAGLPFPGDEGRGFHAVGFAVPDAAKAEAAPYHPPLYATWLALWMRPWGVPGLAWGALTWVLAWWLATGALARSAFGPLAAPVAVALVALGPAAAYYGAQPYAEPAAAALVALGFWALTCLAGGPPRPALALVAGLALGLAVVVKVDALLALAAAAAWWPLARWRSGGWSEALALVAGWALAALQFVSLARGPAALYLSLNAGGLLTLLVGRAAWLALLAALAGIAVLGLWWVLRRRHLDLLGLRRLLAWATAAVVAVALVAGWLAPAEAAPGMVAILAWLVTPLALWAAVAGLFWALEAAKPRSGPVLALVFVAVPVVLVAPVVSQAMSALYIGRRLLPAALTVTAVLAGAALAAWWRWREDRPALGQPSPRWQDATVAAALALGLVGLVAAAHPLTGVGEFRAGETLARRLARHVDAADVIVFPSTLQGADPGRMAAAVWTLAGRDTVVAGAPDRDADEVARAVDAWRARGRQVWYVTDTAHPPPVLPGYELDFQAEEAVVSYALAPRPVLPPEWMPVELQLKLYAVLPLGE